MPAAVSASTTAVHISNRHSLLRQAQLPRQQLRSRNPLAIASPKIRPRI